MESTLEREIEVNESELDEWDKLNADLALRRLNVTYTSVEYAPTSY